VRLIQHVSDKDDLLGAHPAQQGEVLQVLHEVQRVRGQQLQDQQVMEEQQQEEERVGDERVGDEPIVVQLIQVFLVDALHKAHR
jgi:hypothetical protein